jgi:Flp pilus assembly protein TadD
MKIKTQRRAHKRDRRTIAQACSWLLALGLIASLSSTGVLAAGPQTDGQQPDTKIDIRSDSDVSKESDEQASGEIESPDAIQAEEEARKTLEAKAVEHLFLAHKYALRFDFDLAEVEMKEAISYAPELRVVHRDYCLLAIAKGNLGLSIAEFMLATGLGDPIPYTEQEDKLLNLKAAKLHYTKAISYAKDKRWPSAVAELELAGKYAPQNPSIKHSLAFAYASAGQFNLAEQSYKETFELAPQDGFTRADFAFLLSQEGKKDNAVDQMAKAVALQPESAALHMDLAWFAENKGDIEKASKEVTAAVKLSPQHAGLWSHLGRLLEKQDKTAEAKEAYLHAIALDPSQQDAQSALSRLADTSGSKPAE